MTTNTKQYNREYHVKRSKKSKDRKIRLQKERRQKIKLQIDVYKKTKKCKCGEDDIICLDFHHPNNKEINIADATRRGWALEKIMEEIKKCIIVCANCHRKIHSKK